MNDPQIPPLTPTPLDALPNSEAKYRTLFDSIEEGFAIFELIDVNGKAVDFKWVEVNPAYQKQTGLSVTIGQAVGDAMPATEGYWAETFDQVATTGQAAQFENWHEPTARFYATFISRLGGAGSRQVAVLLSDVTERRLQQVRQDFLLTLSDALRPLADPVAMQQTAMTLLAEQLDATRAIYLELAADQDTLDLTARYERETVPIPARMRLSDFTVDQIQQFRRGKAVRVVNTEGEEQRDAYQTIGVRAWAAVPLLKGGQLVAIVEVHCRSPHHWTTPEIQLMEELAGRTWEAVERAKTEQALRQSEAEFRTLTEAAPALVWVCSAGGENIYFNPKWYEYTGQSREDASGHGWTMTMHPDDAARVLPYWQQCQRTGEPYEGEVRYRRHDGVYRWHTFRALPRRTPTGQIDAWYGLSIDTNDAKQAEEALYHSEARQRAILESANEYAIFTADLDRKVTSWNPGAQAVFGYTEEEILHQAADVLFTPEDRQQGAPQYEAHKAIREGRAENERWHIRADGTRFYGSGVVTPLRDQAGSIIGLLKVMRDLTVQKQTEQALRQSEARLAVIFESLPVGVGEVNSNGRLVMTNTEMDRFLPTGVMPSQDAARQERWLGYDLDGRRLEPDDFPGARSLRGERVLPPIEMLYTQDDGTTIWTHVASVPIQDGDGRVTGQVTVVSDINDLKGAQEALKEADRRKDEFLAMLAHELRNPMATVRNGLTILSLTGESDPMAQQAVTMMSRQVEHLVRMVDDLLDVSRISRGKIELKPERLELGGLVAAAVEAIRPQFVTSRKGLHWSPSNTLLFVDGDPTRLSQVVTNLLTNGLRYTNSDGQVWVELSRKGKDALLRVKDNGIGLSQSERSRIFELFVQADTSLARSLGGLGVGLTLVQGLVERHGGRVEAHSPGLGQGSDFLVYLPLLDADDTEPMTPELIHSSEPALPSILIIDDNADGALTLSMLLRLKGYAVHSRQSGRAGIEAAEELRPSVILCDIGMPELDGYQTARLIRQQPWGGAIRLIALTGYGGLEDKQRAQEAGFDGYLVKPVDWAELHRLLAADGDAFNANQWFTRR